MVPDMYKAASTWQKLKAERPADLTFSLRATLLQRFMDVWLQRLESCLATEASTQQAREMLILNAKGSIPCLQYNKASMNLEIKANREPRPSSD